MMSEKIRLVLAKRNKSKAWLAEQLDWSTSNLLKLPTLKVGLVP